MNVCMCIKKSELDPVYKLPAAADSTKLNQIKLNLITKLN
jgi:hypothetical protein